ncbi:hypothetical protein EMMF5_004678 [Cystobasidiomycetes sp. EMM_F5]
MVCYYPGASGCAYQINDINLFLEDPYDSPGCPSHATSCHLKCPVGTQNLNDQSCQPCNKAAGEVSSGGFFGKCVTCPMGQIPNSDNSAGSAQAGLFDRLKGSASSISSSVADAVPSPAGAAAPSPPAEPSLDAFGGSGVQPTQAGSGKGRAAAPAQPGQIIYERVPGEPDPKVVNQVETAVPTQEAHEPYDGTEYRWKMFAHKAFLADVASRAAILTYLAITLLGKRANQAQATAWWKAHVGLLNENFASFLRSPASASLQRSDPTTYYGFASGRRGTSGLVAQITTLPRHDIIALAFTLGYKIYDLSWSPDSGKVNLEFELEHPTEGGKLPAGKEDIIWAIVRRHALMQVREARWDLASFGQPVEPKELSVLPNKQGEQFVILSENGQVTELFLRNSKGPSGILELLGSQEPAAKKAVKWLESIAISDIVAKRPDEPVLEKAGKIPQSRRLTMTMTLPPASHAAETLPLVELALNIVDVLNGSTLSSDVVAKGRKRRTEVYNLLLSESRKEANDKKIAEARAIKKRADEEKREKMTPQERRKLEAKERDKEMKKMAMKQQKK